MVPPLLGEMDRFGLADGKKGRFRRGEKSRQKDQEEQDDNLVCHDGLIPGWQGRRLSWPELRGTALAAGCNGCRAHKKGSSKFTASS